MSVPALHPLTIPPPAPSSPESTLSDDSSLPPITPGSCSPPPSANPGGKKKSTRRANTAERRATHNAVERQRRETLNGRFLELAGLLPNLSQIRRPSKSAIVTSSIAFIHASRRHRILASRELRACKGECDALRRELNEWRHRAGLPRVDEPPRSDGFGIVLSGELELDMEVPQEEDYEDDMGVDDIIDEHRDIKPSGMQVTIANGSPTVSYENPAMPVSWDPLQQPQHPIQQQHMTLPINIPYPHQAPKATWDAPPPAGPYGMPPHSATPHHYQDPSPYPRTVATGPSLLDKYAAAAAVAAVSSGSPPIPQFSYGQQNSGITHQQMMAAAAAAQRSLYTPPHSAHGLPSPTSDGYFYRGPPPPSGPIHHHHHGRERSGSGVSMGVSTDDMVDFVARGVQVPTLPMAGGGTGTGGLMTAMF